MGLREEIREELEEQELRRTQSQEVSDNSVDDSDKNFHGIGWNILHKKFVEGD